MRILITIFTIAICAVTFGQTAQDAYNNGVKKANAQNFSGAIKDYDKAIKLDSNYTDAIYNRGTAKLYMEDFKGAITDFNKTIELKPVFSNAYINRGIAKFKLNDTKSAINDLDIAIKLDSINTLAFLMRGQIKLQLGDIDGGCNDLSQAKKLGDDRADNLIKHSCAGKNYFGAGSLPKENFMLDWPDSEGWKLASNQEDNERRVIELLRNDETFENWTEIGTMMVYPSLKNIPVEAAMKAMYDQAKKDCSSAKLTFLEKDEKSKYPWIIFKIECDSRTPESQVWHIMQGSNEMYINFRAVKQKTIPENLTNKWIKFFKTSKIVTL